MNILQTQVKCIMINKWDNFVYKNQYEQSIQTIGWNEIKFVISIFVLYE